MSSIGMGACALDRGRRSVGGAIISAQSTDMAESSRTDSSRALDDAPDADRDAKIEQLLLAGLDHYFAGRYERAINVWTRALFFDRSHARARAYIDRARSGLAERQRHSEELLQSGVAALDRGQRSEARRLLQAAVDSGARADELHPLVDRLNRDPLDGPSPDRDGLARPAVALRTSSQPGVRTQPFVNRAPARSRVGALLTIAVLSAAVVGVYSVAMGKESRSWFGNQDAPAASVASSTRREAAFPLPRRSEMALGRARALALRGRLHEALAALDAVRATDSERPDADRLRADIQRQLLDFSSTPQVTGAAAGGVKEARRP
jgi:tetratricopeptide (TPR) repeat protein